MTNTMTYHNQTYTKFHVDEMDWGTIILFYKREQYIPVMLSFIKERLL